MNLKESDVIKDIIQGGLDKTELSSLRSKLVDEQGFDKFSNKLLQILVQKDTTVSLVDFLELHGISNKFLFIQNKKGDVIEALAELFYKGHESDLIDFLNTNNDEFNQHVIYLRDTQSAIKLFERQELKKKLEKLDELNAFDLTESDIKIAVVSYERERLRHYLKELANKDKGGSTSGNIIRFNFSQAFKYAAVFVVLLGGAYLIYDNYKVQPQLADNGKKGNATIKSEKTFVTKPETQLPDLGPANVIDFKTKVVQEKNFGFSSSLQPSVNISVIDVTAQLLIVRELIKNEINGKTNVGYGSRSKKLKHIEDSLLNLQGSYLFEKAKKQLTIYSDSKRIQFKKDGLKLILLKDTYYLRYKTDYFFLKEQMEFSKLKKVSNEKVLDELSLINE